VRLSLNLLHRIFSFWSFAVRRELTDLWSPFAVPNATGKLRQPACFYRLHFRGTAYDELKHDPVFLLRHLLILDNN